MTISNQTQEISYTAVGNTGEAFTIPFPFDDDSEIILLEAGVVQTQGTVYTLTGAGTDDGGTATYDSALNPAASATIIIARLLPLTQTTNLLETGRFSAEAVEAQLDRFTMTIQQMMSLNSTDGQTFEPRRMPRPSSSWRTPSPMPAMSPAPPPARSATTSRPRPPARSAGSSRPSCPRRLRRR
jgi:hypothetical protein